MSVLGIIILVLLVWTHICLSLVGWHLAKKSKESDLFETVCFLLIPLVGPVFVIYFYIRIFNNEKEEKIL